MMKKITLQTLKVSAAVFVGLTAGVETASANDLNAIISNVNASVSEVPGLISGLSYMGGILLGVMGVLKLKDHVENPGNAKLKDGAVRLAAGGALFALPIVFEAMQNTIGAGGANVTAPEVNALKFDAAP